MFSRPDTGDYHIMREVFLDNVYGFPFRETNADSFLHNVVFEPDSMTSKICIDIGAHIGCFCLLASQLGAKKIYAYEPESDNFSYLSKNVASLKKKGQIELNQQAVWRSDVQELVGVEQTEVPRIQKDNPALSGVLNPAQYRYTTNGSDKTSAESLDSIISRVIKESLQSPDFLKIDCEGAEYAILYTSSAVHEVNTIAGELHLHDHGPSPEYRSFNGYEATVESFEAFLRDRGFNDIHMRSMDYDLSRPIKESRSVTFRADKDSR